jgi:hypothetical protein
MRHYNLSRECCALLIINFKYIPTKFKYIFLKVFIRFILIINFICVLGVLRIRKINLYSSSIAFSNYLLLSNLCPIPHTLYIKRVYSHDLLDRMEAIFQLVNTLSSNERYTRKDKRSVANLQTHTKIK